MKKLSHIDRQGNPAMVDVSEKKVTRRTAAAKARVWLGKEIMKIIERGELTTKKGPVFQTAILAGVMGAKQTASLIPLCHPLGTEDCQVTIHPHSDHIVITSSVVVTAKTGAEMEALTAVTIAALTVYDMCKALSHDILIERIELTSKTGGKNDVRRK